MANPKKPRKSKPRVYAPASPPTANNTGPSIDPYLAIRQQIAFYETMVIPTDRAQLARDEAILAGLKSLLPVTV